MTRRKQFPIIAAPVLSLALIVLTTERAPAQTTGQLDAVFAAFGTVRRLPGYQNATELVRVDGDVAGRVQWLSPDAAASWCEMRRSAQTDGVTLLLVSAFRSFEQQRQIFERKFRAGQTLAEVLTVNVPPGFSEHHSGRAVDVGTPGSTALLEDFERTPAFRWLEAHAERYGFSLSYPRGNRAGLAYEPWHWAFGRGRESRLLR